MQRTKIGCDKSYVFFFKKCHLLSFRREEEFSMQSFSKKKSPGLLFQCFKQKFRVKQLDGNRDPMSLTLLDSISFMDSPLLAGGLIAP